MKIRVTVLLLFTLLDPLLGWSKGPCATFLVPPQYPPMARVAGISGTITVRATIDEKGEVTSAEAVPWNLKAYTPARRKAMEDNHRILSRAALDNVKKWRFEPPDKGPGVVEVTVEYDFRMEGRPTYYQKVEVRFHLPTRVEIITQPPSPNP